MARASEGLARAREEEIVSACAALYETMGFKDVTLRDIGEKTSFTRTSIYNYFQTKEEIFLALLQREHEAWSGDLDEIARQPVPMSASQFAHALARTLERRARMLKLMSMNLYDMEVNSRLENLVEFKRAYAGALAALRRCLRRFFPSMGEAEIQSFLYTLFPFLFGVYPYTAITEKQAAAMALAGVEIPHHTVSTLIQPLAETLLRPYSPQ